jgi:RimJ/RimL family protein N-acetyltransferase
MHGDKLSDEGSGGERLEPKALYTDTFKSPRLSIEPLAQAHAPKLYPGLEDKRVYEWISAKPPTSLSALTERYAVLESRRQLASTIHASDIHSATHSLDWALRLTNEGHSVGKLDAEIEGTVATNIGYIVFAEFWNQGFATEAIQALATQLERAGVVEQRAYVTRGNNASVRVLEKSNFHFTRILADNDTIRGQKFDDLEFVRKV